MNIDIGWAASAVMVALLVGAAIGGGVRRKYVIASAPEYDMLAEIKRRRFESKLKASLAQQVNNEVDTELGVPPPPNPKKG